MKQTRFSKFYFYFRDENEVVPQVVQAVLSIPSTAHIAVRYTTLQLLGELCEWIDSHSQVIGNTHSLLYKMHCLQYFTIQL
jgi:hypothetical protein